MRKSDMSFRIMWPSFGLKLASPALIMSTALQCIVVYEVFSLLASCNQGRVAAPGARFRGH